MAGKKRGRAGAPVFRRLRLGRRLAGAALAMVTAPVLALASETTVVLNGGIAATLNIPDNVDANAPPAPAVLMLHGFGSSRNEVGNMFASQADALAAMGIASLRIDFRGFGKSDGDTGATTVDSQLDDAKVGLAYLSKVKGIDAARVGVLGFSLGGGVGMLAAADEPQKIKSLVTWSSVGDFKADFLGSLGQKAFDRAKEDGIVGIDLGWRTIALKQAFFDSLENRKLDEAIGKYPGAYMAVAGSKDSSAGYVQKFISLAKGKTKFTYIVPEGDHTFGATGQDKAKVNDVILKTTEWFSKTL
jgi:pimeloyl-ACP methyl ester carboxylesterase